MSKLTLLVILMASCLSGEDYDSFGDVATEMSQALCVQRLDCGLATDVGSCRAHQVYHLCVIDNTCHDPVGEYTWGLLDQCVSAIYQAGCWDIQWYWPYPCQKLLSHVKGF